MEVQVAVATPGISILCLYLNFQPWLSLQQNQWRPINASISIFQALKPRTLSINTVNQCIMEAIGQSNYATDFTIYN